MHAPRWDRHSTLFIAERPAPISTLFVTRRLEIWRRLYRSGFTEELRNCGWLIVAPLLRPWFTVKPKMAEPRFRCLFLRLDPSFLSLSGLRPCTWSICSETGA